MLDWAQLNKNEGEGEKDWQGKKDYKPIDGHSIQVVY